MSVDCIPEVVRTRRQYPAAPPNRLSRKNRPDGRFFVGYQDKREDPVTARKTGSSVWSVELYILESMFVFGLWIIILFKSYLYNKALKCSCQ